ncbi:hypothetical protein ND861_14670 [Leptospira sp. 2 VSF19]|uniref:Uncharacterized protein n=1 Tax=Leptospira soteropolitanensis TaxID=2950025 RepID=A0AAW5VFF2_9LEPT|nr:hypothetical protein [Leptospira soteropolitanensis]MCW7493908.1 hypothetical protein [Leptospira soteropolitanensis]MCW7501502.1 hypothetical protein [Leptospira soteropolitanensis]MCW7527599.1 hypothetical protein [Leptospira soteropolitanensis]MCW7531453.1 hypothetical protein [Leptospira soteropolitanensis]
MRKIHNLPFDFWIFPPIPAPPKCVMAVLQTVSLPGKHFVRLFSTRENPGFTSVLD